MIDWANVNKSILLTMIVGAVAVGAIIGIAVAVIVLWAMIGFMSI